MTNRAGATRTNHCRPPLAAGTRVRFDLDHWTAMEGEVVAVRRPKFARRYRIAYRFRGPGGRAEPEERAGHYWRDQFEVVG